MKDFLEIVKNAKGELITIAARPAMGKSTLAIDIINSVNEGNVLYFNLESSVRQLIDRIHRDNVYIINVAGTTISTIKDICETIIMSKTCLSMLVIDYLQLVNDFDKSKSLKTKERDIVFELKNIALKYNIPVILISQLGREVDLRDDKRPQLSDIDYHIVSCSSTIVSLYSEYRYAKLFDSQIENKNLIDTELIYLKNNNNQLNNIKIVYDKSKCSFVMG